MASNRDTLNGPDWKDVANGLEELGRECGAFVTITITSKSTRGRPGLLITAVATVPDPAVPEAECSALARRVMHTQPGGDLSRELLFLLYDLDSNLAKKLYPEDTETA